MKKWSTLLICLFTAACILLNIGGRWLADHTGIFLWMDSFGTVLCAYVGGPVCGCIVGLTANLIYGMINHLSAFYALTSMATGIIVGMAARKKKLNNWFEALTTASVVTVASVIISFILNLYFANGYTGNQWGDGVIDFFKEHHLHTEVACFLGELYIDFPDKSITLLCLYALICLVRRIRGYNGSEMDEQSVENLEEEVAHPELIKMVGWVLACCLGGGILAICIGTAKAEAEVPEIIDYNDYVQTIYSSSNGLPCGEANDIEETQDGIIWIGTYAGLYRYNGTEFRWMNGYDSIRNVNCLFVDEEGRLWIGTNDNGLSIVINENVVNVLDQDGGLPSNSVRSIIKGSDDYYYIGTTGSMQILTLNSGLKKVNTLSEINFSDNSCADENGHVAAIASNGRLFLLSHGQIQSSCRLVEGNEQFNCCIFDAEGMLLAGTSANHIYRYDISSGGFERIGEVTCEGLSGINDLEYLDDGILFITSDNGVGFMNQAHQFDLINTNAFNNSIDHMLVDYQGNFWFTSSRLGLLRMAPSSFKDIYSTIGMENRVVNTVEYWNGNLYIGTDKGLDVVDSTCRKQIANDLTKQFEGVRIRCLDADDEGNLWICTYGNGLIEVEPDNTQHLYNSAKGSFGNRARLVTQLRDGTIAAAGDMGISFIRDHEIQKTIRYSDGLINSMILTLVERTDGRIFAGTDGDGIAVIEDGRVMRMITRADGLSSGVILRMIPDPKTDGVFVVTSNGLCYMDGQDQIRLLDRFPYFNNYDIWVKDPDTLFVMSSAGIYVVDRDSLVDSEDALIYDLLDAKRGLNSAITANSWTYSDGNGDLFLACDTGVFVVDTDTYASGTATYRMSIRSVRLDGNLQQLDYGSAIQLSRDTARIELYPEIINFTIQDPDVGYKLDGFDTNWSFVTQSELNSIVYTNLPSGEYTLHLAVFDGNRENILEERQYRIVKAQKINDNNWFVIYIIVVAMLTVLWITYFFTKWRNKREIDEKNRQLAMGNQTILAIANTVDAKDVRTSQHSLRVSIYSEKIGHKLGLSEQECKNLESAARLHDIGKIGIPDVILNKPSRLTDEEYAVMKSHVMRGANILKGFTLIDHVVEGAMYHHERYDGKGYPKGQKGEEIPLYGRIIGVADAFDAMTANRVYRKQMDFGYVLNEMRNGRGTQFDPQIVDILLKLIDDGEIDLNKLYPAHTDNEKTE